MHDIVYKCSRVLLHGAVVIGFDGRVSRMASVQSVGEVEDDIVTCVSDFWVVIFSRDNLNVLESESVTWSVLGAIDPDDSVAGRCTGEVFKVDI